MTERTVQRNPQTGDDFRLDGLSYELGTTGQLPNEARNGFVTVREATRPDPVDEAEATAHKDNFHYKKTIAFLEQELVWTEPEQWLADLREQAETLARTRPGSRVWCEEASEVLEAQYAKAGPAWTLPGRHLLKPPVRFNPNTNPAGQVIGYESFYPQDRKEAARLAAAILAHEPCPVVPLANPEKEEG